MGDKQRRDYGSGSISQRKDGTWTARVIVGTNEAGKPRVKAFYGKSEREVKKKMKEFEKELHKNVGSLFQGKKLIGNFCQSSVIADHFHSHTLHLTICQNRRLRSIFCVS